MAVANDFDSDAICTSVLACIGLAMEEEEEEERRRRMRGGG